MRKMELEESLQNYNNVSKTLRDQKSSGEDRIKAYTVIQNSLKCGPASCEFNVFAKYAQTLSELIVTEITCKKDDPDTSALVAALQLLGCLLRCESFTKSLNKEVCQDIICGLCGLTSSICEKNIAKTALWCLSSWKHIPANGLTETIEVIFSSLEMVLDDKKTVSLTIEFEAVRVIQWLVVNNSASLTRNLSTCLKLLFPRLFHGAARIRFIAFQSFEKLIPILSQHRDAVVPSFGSMIKADLHKGVNHMFGMNLECYTLKVWCIIVRFMNKVLHHGSSIINCLLEVVEKAFKNQTPEIRISAFMAWKELIDNFAKDLDVLSSSKRLRLILEPLKINNAKTDAVIQAKVEVWWHLIFCLQQRLSSHFEWVVIPLLAYCFGPFEENSSTKNNTKRNIKPGLLDVPSKFASPALGYKPLILKLSGCKMFLMLLGDSLSDSTAIARRSPRKVTVVFDLVPLNCHQLSSPLFFIKYAQTYFQAAKFSHEILTDPNLGDEHHCLLLRIWTVLIQRIMQISQCKNETGTHTVLQDFFNFASNVIKANSTCPAINLKILHEIIHTFPPKILATPKYHIGSADIMQGTPSSLLINILFNPSILSLCQRDNESLSKFLDLYSRLMAPTMQINLLGFAKSVIQILSSSTASISNMEIISNLWIILAEYLNNQVEKTQEVNEGDALSYDFSSFYQVLTFPIQNIFPKISSDQSFVTDLLSCWSNLYKTFSRCANLVVNAPTDAWCEDLCTKYIQFLKDSSSEDNIYYNCLARITYCMVENFNYKNFNINDGLESSTSKSKKASKFKGLKNFKSCSEFITKILLKVGEKLKEFDPSSQKNFSMDKLVASLCDVIDYLISRITQPLALSELLKTFSTSIASMISYDQESDSKINCMWKTITKTFQAYYHGQYDENMLVIFSPLIKATLTHSSLLIKNNTRIFWHATFGQSPSLKHPDDLRDVLCKMRPSVYCKSDQTSEETISSPASQTATEATIPPQLLRTPPSNKPFGSFLKNSSTKVQKARKSFPRPKVNINDLNSQDFVVIKTPPSSKKMKLTSHQKDVMKNRTFVPSMYNDLSQDTFQDKFVPFSTDSQDTQFSQINGNESSHGQKSDTSNQQSQPNETNGTGQSPNSVGVMICPIKDNDGSTKKHVFRVPLNCVKDDKLRIKTSIKLNRCDKTKDDIEHEQTVIQETPTDEITANDEFVPSSQGSISPEKNDLRGDSVTKSLGRRGRKRAGTSPKKSAIKSKKRMMVGQDDYIPNFEVENILNTISSVVNAQPLEAEPKTAQRKRGRPQKKKRNIHSTKAVEFILNNLIDRVIEIANSAMAGSCEPDTAVGGATDMPSLNADVTESTELFNEMVSKSSQVDGDEIVQVSDNSSLNVDVGTNSTEESMISEIFVGDPGTEGLDELACGEALEDEMPALLENSLTRRRRKVRKSMRLLLAEESEYIWKSRTPDKFKHKNIRKEDSDSKKSKLKTDVTDEGSDDQHVNPEGNVDGQSIACDNGSQDSKAYSEKSPELNENENADLGSRLLNSKVEAPKINEVVPNCEDVEETSSQVSPEVVESSKFSPIVAENNVDSPENLDPVEVIPEDIASPKLLASVDLGQIEPNFYPDSLKSPEVGSVSEDKDSVVPEDIIDTQESVPKDPQESSKILKSVDLGHIAPDIDPDSQKSPDVGSVSEDLDSVVPENSITTQELVPKDSQESSKMLESIDLGHNKPDVDPDSQKSPTVECVSEDIIAVQSEVDRVNSREWTSSVEENVADIHNRTDGGHVENTTLNNYVDHEQSKTEMDSPVGPENKILDCVDIESEDSPEVDESESAAEISPLESDEKFIAELTDELLEKVEKTVSAPSWTENKPMDTNNNLPFNDDQKTDEDSGKAKKEGLQSGDQKQLHLLNTLIKGSPMSRAQMILRASLKTAEKQSTSLSTDAESSPSHRTPKRCLESPNSSPNSILKKRKLVQDQSNSSTKKHVSFADPPVQKELELPANKRSIRRSVNRCLSMKTKDSDSESPPMENESCGSQQLNSEEVLEMDNNQSLFPQLISCHHNVSILLNGLTSSMWVRGLEQLLKSQNITTVGQFCSLSENDIMALPIKTPKLYTTKSCLSKYLKKIKAAQKEIEPTTEANSDEDVDENYVLCSVEETLKSMAQNDDDNEEKCEDNDESIKLTIVEDVLNPTDQSEEKPMNYEEDIVNNLESLKNIFQKLSTNPASLSKVKYSSLSNYQDELCKISMLMNSACRSKVSSFELSDKL